VSPCSDTFLDFPGQGRFLCSCLLYILWPFMLSGQCHLPPSYDLAPRMRATSDLTPPLLSAMLAHGLEIFVEWTNNFIN
jgi:hypothetical protein